MRQFKFQEAAFFIRYERCACGTEVRGLCTLIDRQHAARMETEGWELLAFYLPPVVNLIGLAPRLLQCVFFTWEFLKSFSDGRLYRSIIGSHNQIKLYCHPGGFISAGFLVGSMKMSCWVQLGPP